VSGFLVPNPNPSKGSGPASYQFPVMKDVILRRDGVGGSWQVYISGGHPLPASAVEVALWVELQQARGQHGSEAAV
jgi:hypothetical protein